MVTNNKNVLKSRVIKCLGGTPRGGLVPRQTSGTWGDRGKGNELLSGLENTLSWIGDKVINFGDYLEDGLSYLIGSIPGGKFDGELMVENNRRKREAKNNGALGYEDVSGEYKMLPITGMPPALPALPKNASSALIDSYRALEKQWRSYSARESQMKKAGLLDLLKNTLTVKRYEEKERAFNQAVEEAKANQPHMKRLVSDVKLTRKLDAGYKGTKAVATDDMRAYNQGRPVMKSKQWDYVEEVMRKDPKVEGILNRYDRKVAKGLEKKHLREARKKMLEEYAKSRPGFFDYLLKK